MQKLLLLLVISLSSLFANTAPKDFSCYKRVNGVVHLLEYKRYYPFQKDDVPNGIVDVVNYVRANNGNVVLSASPHRIGSFIIDEFPKVDLTPIEFKDNPKRQKLAEDSENEGLIANLLPTVRIKGQLMAVTPNVLYARLVPLQYYTHATYRQVPRYKYRLLSDLYRLIDELLGEQSPPGITYRTYIDIVTGFEYIDQFNRDLYFELIPLDEILKNPRIGDEFTWLGEIFEITKVLKGFGSSNRVFEAQSLKDGHEYIFKYSNNKEDATYWQNEADALDVVDPVLKRKKTVKSIVMQDGQNFVQLEKLDGIMFAAYLPPDLKTIDFKDYTEHEWDLIEGLFIDVYKALVQVHRDARLVHGDLKSSNVLIHDTWEKRIVNIIDWQASNKRGNKGLPHYHTQEFLSPEKLHNITHSNTLDDLYAVGIMFAGELGLIKFEREHATINDYRYFKFKHHGRPNVVKLLDALLQYLEDERQRMIDQWNKENHI